MAKAKIPDKWKGEQKAIKAIQVAFDLDERVQYVIRREALEMDINPSERMRQILGLATHKLPQRPRLSVSLKPEDFQALADKYQVAADDRRAIKQRATQELQQYAEGKRFSDHE